MIDVSIIIVSYNSLDEILINIKSIKKHVTSLSYEILVVNNSVKDKRLSAVLKKYVNVIVIEAGSNLGFGRANNLGLKHARGKYILFVNPDVIFLSDISQLALALEQDAGVGIVGPVTYNMDEKIFPSCGEYPSVRNYISFNLFANKLFPAVRWWGNYPMSYFSFREAREVEWIAGAFMLGRKDTFEQIGGFDEDFFMFGEDIDICWRLKKAGYRILFSDKASIIHNVGHSFRDKSIAKAKMMAEGSKILWGKHYSSQIVRKLFFILYLGSLIRKYVWQILNLTKISKRKDMSEYYRTLISECKINLRSIS